MLSIKYYEDRVIWNIDFVEKTQLFDLQLVNKLEHLYIKMCDFDLKVENRKVEEYFKWLQLYKQFISDQDSQDC